MGMIQTWDYKLKWPVRILYLFLVAFYVHTLRQQFSYMPISLWLYLKWTIICGLWNSGLWIITTKWAKRWKLLSILLYFPTLISSTILLPWSGWFSALGCFLFLLVILIIFLPWRDRVLWTRV
jgi:hypothetical protein